MHKQLFLWAAIFWNAFVSYLCLVQSSHLPAVSVQNSDKVVHAFFHFILTTLWFMYLRLQLKSTTVLKPLLLSVLFSLVFGITIEILQGLLTTTRKADIYDVFANTVGSMLAFSLFYIIYKRSTNKI